MRKQRRRKKTVGDIKQLIALRIIKRDILGCPLHRVAVQWQTVDFIFMTAAA